MDSVWLYLLINHILYCDDDRKITFALSYMKKGATATWAEVCCQQGLATLLFGTFSQFQTNFETAFGNTNAAQEAMNWLSTTCIDSNEQLPEYINNFKLNIVQAKYDELKDTTLSTELAIASDKEEVTLPPQYTKYTDVSAKQTFDTLPPQQDFDHAIELKDLFTPKVAKLYPLNLQELDACKAFIKENLKTGWIQQLKSPQASLFFFVKKKTENSDPYKTTDTWMSIQLRTHTHYPWSRT